MGKIHDNASKLLNITRTHTAHSGYIYTDINFLLSCYHKQNVILYISYLCTKRKKLCKVRPVKIFFESANCVVSSYKMQMHY